MGAIQEFDIFLDDSLEVYHSGEKLTGHVLLTLTKDLAMKGKLLKMSYAIWIT